MVVFIILIIIIAVVIIGIIVGISVYCSIKNHLSQNAPRRKTISLQKAGNTGQPTQTNEKHELSSVGQDQETPPSNEKMQSTDEEDVSSI